MTGHRQYDFLIIDDSISVRKDIREILDEHGLVREFYQASDGLEGFQLLTTRHVDLILCDLVMPKFDGYKFLILKEKRSEYENVPVIMLTSVEKVEQKVKGLESGASDYIIKPFEPEELLARVRVQLKVKNLQEDLKQANERLRILSITDELTGLYNRRYLMESLGKEMERARRYERMLSFVLMDIDHFKKVNDQFGHSVGDEVLRKLGKMLLGSLRHNDIAARYGGEELSLVLPETHIDGAVILSERIRKKISQVKFSADGASFSVTVSFGVTGTNGDETVEEIMTRVDDALYRAKYSGRNKVENNPPPNSSG